MILFYKKWNKRRSDSGQASIEFIIVSIVVLFFLLFFLSLAMLLVISDYMEYATFMAARTYKAAVGSVETQRRHARRVLLSYANKVNNIVKNVDIAFVSFGRRQTEGIRVTYEVSIFYLPPIFISRALPDGNVQLTSEVHLGREPNFAECQSFFERFLSQFGLNGMASASEMADNGC